MNCLYIRVRRLLQFLTGKEHLHSSYSMNCYEKPNLQRDYKSPSSRNTEEAPFTGCSLLAAYALPCSQQPAYQYTNNFFSPFLPHPFKEQLRHSSTSNKLHNLGICAIFIMLRGLASATKLQLLPKLQRPPRCSIIEAISAFILCKLEHDMQIFLL